ncbi:hypothetical protein ACIPK7_25620 [Pseudomonas sp. NPDC086581]|uniref:hypothetical protein n=1 Tax=Pseudomonas sp. NPDC086581 TaxID=3364432 RepID=UPI0037F75E69
MKKLAAAFIEENSSIPLKDIETTRSSTEYLTKPDNWAFRDGVKQISMNFKNIPQPYSDLIPHIKKLFTWELKHKSPSTANTLFHTLIYLLRNIQKLEPSSPPEITAEQIIVFKLQKKNHVHILAAIRPLLVDWSDLKLPGFGQEACKLIKSLKLKQYPLGEAVRTHDPIKGPFTDLEFDTISASLTNSYADGLINRENYILCYLFMTLAPRPVQAASLKCMDFELLPDGTYILRLPRAKKENKLLRSEFKKKNDSKAIRRDITFPRNIHKIRIQGHAGRRRSSTFISAEEKTILRKIRGIRISLHLSCIDI